MLNKLSPFQKISLVSDLTKTSGIFQNPHTYDNSYTTKILENSIFEGFRAFELEKSAAFGRDFETTRPLFPIW